jgi:hypothetical protein
VSAPVFTRTFALPDGPRVGLRLAMPRDAERVACLLRERGVEASELDLRRLLTYDPSRRRVVLAFAPVEGRDVLVGIAAIDLAPGADVDTLVVDEDLAGGIGPFLGAVVRDRAARSRRVA